MEASCIKECERPIIEHPGSVDDAIQAAVTTGDLIEQPLHCARIGDIARDRPYFGPALP